MIKDNYQARVYSPLDGNKDAEEMYGPTRLLQGKREKWDGEKFVDIDEIKIPGTDEVADYSVASNVHDYYEMSDINNPEITEEYRKRLFMKLRAVKHPEAMMPKGTTMVPRVFKTNVGDIFTTNTINADTLKVGDILAIGTNGILCPEANANAETVAAKPSVDPKENVYETTKSGDMRWQVVKVYTMPDHQKGVKIMRIV
jgi:hypothetical protein